MADRLDKSNREGSAARPCTTAAKQSLGQSSTKKTRSAFARHDATKGSAQEDNAPQRETEPREGDDERLDEALKESFPASDPLPIKPGPERGS